MNKNNNKKINKVILKIIKVVDFKVILMILKGENIIVKMNLEALILNLLMTMNKVMKRNLMK